MYQVVDEQPRSLDHKLPRTYGGVDGEPLQPGRGLVERTYVDGDSLALGQSGSRSSSIVLP